MWFSMVSLPRQTPLLYRNTENSFRRSQWFMLLARKHPNYSELIFWWGQTLIQQNPLHTRACRVTPTSPLKLGILSIPSAHSIKDSLYFHDQLVAMWPKTVLATEKYNWLWRTPASLALTADAIFPGFYSFIFNKIRIFNGLIADFIGHLCDSCAWIKTHFEIYLSWRK